MTDAVVRAENVYTRFGRLEVLRGVSLEVAPREVLCVIGPSGPGKSTFLRCINDLEPAAHLRAVPGRAGGCRRVARKAGLHDPLTDEDVKACQRVRSVPGHDDHSALTSRP